MGPEAIVTVVGVALIVGALAVYLIVISYSLYKVSYTLGTVLIGVRAIAARCEPLSGVVSSVANDVAAVERAMERLAAGRGGEGEAEELEQQEAEGEEDQQYEVVEDYEEEEEEVQVIDRPRRRRRARR